MGENTMCVKYDVFDLLDQVGDQTSLDFLVDKISKVYTGWTTSRSCRKSYICTIRGEWRRTRKIKRDARTHEDIPRRNMMNDNKVNRSALDELTDYVDEYAADLAAIVEQFHSKEQVIKALEHIQTMQEIDREYVTI
jgi:hypothetical protein